MKPYSQACENNKIPILNTLNQHLLGNEHVLEIGSGTGQHARFFADYLPNILWQTSDVAMNHPGIRSWIQDCRHHNAHPPLNLNVVDEKAWPSQLFDAIFTANTLHIMSWYEVTVMLEKVAAHLKDEGRFFIYGPFKQNSVFTSPSNASFDASLRHRNASMGIRDLEVVQKEAEQHHMVLKKVHDMPAYNMMLVMCKSV